MSAIEPVGHEQDKAPILSETLENAYQIAEALTQRYSRSFYLASSLLPKAERRAIRALYGFCRYTDNLVDDEQETPFTDLVWWREEVNRRWQEQDRPILMAWAHARERYQVPTI